MGFLSAEKTRDSLWLFCALLANCALLPNCGGSTNSPGGDGLDPTQRLDLMQDRLATCDLWEKGELSRNFEGDEAQCVAECFGQHEDCDAARAYACMNVMTDTPLGNCIRTCRFFECAEGTMVYSFNLCDGQFDCPDGSDETDCAQESTFTCNNGVRIPASWQCNIEIDCGQGEDETDCASDYFHCDDGEVLPLRWRCDLQADCKDGSDEGPTCARKTCD